MSDTTTLQTRDQKYATIVYRQIERRLDEEIERNPAAKNKPEISQYLKSYGSMAHQLPILIRTAGLAQAIAFVHAKSATPPTEEEMQGDPKKKLWKSTHAQYQLLEDITTMLRTQGVSEAQNGAEFVKQCLTLPLLRYMYLTQQVLDALLWYKRFAQSVLNVEASDAGDNAGNEMIGG